MDLTEKITQERVENSLKVYKNRSRLVEFPDDVEFISRALREDFKISLFIFVAFPFLIILGLIICSVSFD